MGWFSKSTLNNTKFIGLFFALKFNNTVFNGVYILEVELKEKIIKIDNTEFFLLPNAEKAVADLFENTHGYNDLNIRAMANYQRESINTPLVDEHLYLLNNLLPKELCQSLISEFDKNPKGIEHDSVAEVLLPQVFNDQLDEQLRSYFSSEYCIFWWSIYKVESHVEDEWYFTKWHCDGGPKKHIKVIIYLNGYDEHESDTAYLDKISTDELKNVGYIFNNIDNRSLNISPLCQHFNIPFNPQSFKPNAGDAILFNPNQIAHRAMAPKKGKTRYALNFCVLPSELHWKTVAEKFYFPVFGCQNFKSFTDIAKKITTKKQNNNSCIEVGLNYQIENFQHLEYLLANIIKDLSTTATLLSHIHKEDPLLKQCGSIFSFFKYIKNIIIAQLNPSQVMEKKWLEALSNIAIYEQQFIDAKSRYGLDNKPNANAVFWPNPVHEKYPQSKFNMLPYVRKEPIMDINTPIGSAGSCFAFEIAKYFQQGGYNYVVTERNDDPNSGVLVDGYQPGDKYAKFCANFGILFNTPSFTQLAEKAFGIRQFNKLLFKDENGYLLDPYRENVLFKSKEAYLADYDKHINAAKEAFLQCKVFVVTLGLNECWQLQDGTVMSRNPRENMYHLVKHRTLTVQENVDNIQRFFDIIKQYNPDFKLVISVSPIPFLATGRADKQHIISANSHSKSVLRVAADQLVENNPDMYYLPSYELVNECIEDAWEKDTRHVKSTTVEKVVSMFKEIFLIS